MKYLGLKNIKPESNFSYWNPPVGKEYIEQGSGYQIDYISPNRVSNQAFFQINVGGTITNYVISNGSIFSYPYNNLSAPATLEVDLQAVYGMSAGLTSAIGDNNGTPVIAIASTLPGSDKLLILSWDGFFTLINQVNNPTGFNTGLNNIQWDDNSNHFYASSPIGSNNVALKISPTGVVVNSITSSSLISSYTSNGFIFVDANTALIKGIDNYTGTWNLAKCDLNNFTIDELNPIDLRDTTNGYFNPGPINSIICQLVQQVGSKVLIVMRVIYGSTDVNLKLVFDTVNFTTYWSGDFFWPNSVVTRYCYSENNNLLAINLSSSTTPAQLIDTSTDFFNESEIELNYSGPNASAFSIDSFSSDLYSWEQITFSLTEATKYLLVNKTSTGTIPAGSIEKRFYTENKFGTIKGNITNNTFNFKCYKVIEGTGVSVTETSGNITYEETVQEVRNNSEPYLFENFSIYANSVEQLNIQLTKIAKGVAGESKTSFNYPTLLDQKQLVALNLPMNFTPKTISKMGYKVKAFESVRLIINYTKGSLNKHIDQVESYIEDGVSFSGAFGQIESKLSPEEKMYLKDKFINRKKHGEAKDNFILDISKPKNSKNKLLSKLDKIINNNRHKSFGVDGLSDKNIKRLVAERINENEVFDPSNFKD